MPSPSLTVYLPATTLNIATGWSVSHTTVRLPSAISSLTSRPTAFAVYSSGSVTRVRTANGIPAHPMSGSVSPS